MFKNLIESASQSGSEMVVLLKGVPESFRGSVQDFDGKSFTFLQAGCCYSMVWAFRLEDVLSCALVVPVPGLTYCPLSGAPDEEQPINF